MNRKSFLKSLVAIIAIPKILIPRGEKTYNSVDLAKGDDKIIYQEVWTNQPIDLRTIPGEILYRDPDRIVYKSRDRKIYYLRYYAGQWIEKPYLQ